MRKNIVLAAVGAIIMVVGIVVLIVGLSMNEWSPAPKFVETEYVQESTDVEKISIDFSGAPIAFFGADIKTEFYGGDKVEITYYRSSTYETEVTESEGVIKFVMHYKLDAPINYLPPEPVSIRLPDGNIYDIDIVISRGTFEIAEGKYGNIDAELNTKGEFLIKNSTFGTLDIALDDGSIHALDMVCDSLSFTMNNHSTADFIGLDAKHIEVEIDGYSFTVIKCNFYENECNVTTEVDGYPETSVEVDGAKHELIIKVFNGGNYTLDFAELPQQ